MLSIEADLRLEIDGRAATLTGSGTRLTLELESARTTRSTFDIELPRVRGTNANPRPIPAILAAQGTSVAVRDRRGLLFVAGADAKGASLSLPFVGTLEHVVLGGPTALRRLASGR